MGLIGSLTQAVTNTVGNPTTYNTNFESIRAAFDDYAVLTDTARTITVQHTFNPTSAQAPFLIGANGTDQMVTGLNAAQASGVANATASVQIFAPATELSAITTSLYYPLFRMPFAGWLGRPIIQLVTAYTGGSNWLGGQIYHGDNSASATLITTTTTKIVAGEDNSEDNAQKHVFSGTDQANAQRSAGDWIWLKHNVIISAPTSYGEGMIVTIPIFGTNPHI
jgi:hypothetical protein